MQDDDPRDVSGPEETDLSKLDPEERARIEAGIERLKERIQQDNFSYDPVVGEKQYGGTANVIEPWPTLEPLPPLPPLSIDQAKLEEELRERDSGNTN